MFHGKRSRTESVKSFRNPRGLWVRRQYKIITVSLLWLLSYSSFAGAQVLNDPALLVKEVVSGLNQPTAMAFIRLGDILVLPKGDGRVRLVIHVLIQPV